MSGLNNIQLAERLLDVRKQGFKFVTCIDGSSHDSHQHVSLMDVVDRYFM